MLLILAVCFKPEAPKYWLIFPDSYDYLEQSKHGFFNKDLYSPERGERLVRPFTVPLFYKLTGSDFSNFMIFQSVFYCLCVWFFITNLLSFFKRPYLKVCIIPILYFLFSWWNIVGWTNQGLSEHLSFCFLLLWLGALIFFFNRLTVTSFVILLCITVLHSFTRDTWAYLILITPVILAVFYFKHRSQPVFKFLLIYFIFSGLLFFIQQKTIDIGQRYRLSVYNNIFVRLARSPDYINWFKKEGLPLADKISEEFSRFDIMKKGEAEKLYTTYTDPAYSPVFDWAAEKGKSAYTKFLLTHPDYLFLLDQTKQERERIFCYNLTSYIGGAPGYFQVPEAVLPLFNVWIVTALCALIFWLYLKKKESDIAYVFPLFLMLLTIANVFLSYNAEAMEVERHMYYTVILLELIGWISVFLITEFFIGKYERN